MIEITAVQRKILGVLYFREPFSRIVEDAAEKPQVVKDELKFMISRRWVNVMAYDPVRKDFASSSMYDVDHFEDYEFVLTPRGMAVYNQPENAA